MKFQILFLFVVLQTIYGSSVPEQIRLAVTGKATEMTIMWCTQDEFPESTVYYRTGSETQWTKASGAPSLSHYYWPIPPADSPHIHTLKLQGLKPETQYWYKIGDSAQNTFTNVSYFFTPKLPNTVSPSHPVHIASIADMGTSPNSKKVVDLLAALHAKDPFDSLVHAGDISYANGIDKYWDIWGNMVSPVSNFLPWMVSVGNHEIFDAFVPFLWRFTMPSKESGAPMGNLYFSYNYGNIHFISLSSESLEYWHFSDQYEWLEEDLKNVNRQETPWIVASWHSPWYCSNTKHQDSGKDMRDSFEDLLFQHKVDLVLDGHVHAYERTLAVYRGELNPSGPIFITNGVGGTEEGTYDHWVSPPPAWSAKRYADWAVGEFWTYNSTHLKWRLTSAETHQVVDEYLLVRTR